MSKNRAIIQALASSLKKRSNVELVSLDDPNSGVAIRRRVPTSIRLLNSILGGGIPCGRLTEIFGEESNGKSSLAADILAQTQKAGGIACLIDSEHAFDPEFAAKLGVNIPDLFFTDKEAVEEAFEFIDAVIENTRELDLPVVIVWDSVAASPTLKEREEGIDAKSMGEKARLLSKGTRRIVGKLGANVALVFLNQVRTKMNVMYGKPTDAVGGFALKFFASIRLELSKVGIVKEGEKPVGIRIRAHTFKNKTYPPLKKIEYEFYFDGRISEENQLLDLLVQANVISQSGSWYVYGKKKFQRKDFQAHLEVLESSIAEALKTL